MRPPPPRAPARARAAAAALAVLVVLAGCGGSPAPGAGADTTAPPAAGADATTPPGGTAGPATSPAAAPTPNGTDLAWVQLLIAMNERLAPVLDLAPGRTDDPAVERRAARTRRTSDTELAALRRLTHGLPLPTENPHAAHDMPGMTTAADRARLTAARGADFDRQLADAVRAHLDQTIRLCAGEQTAGADPSFKQAAERMREAAENERHRWT